MPFSNRPETGGYTQNMQHYTVLQERFALLRCMSDTALGKLYWAQDLKQPPATTDNANLFIFSIAPNLAQNIAFEQALKQVISSYQHPAIGVPQIIDNGKETNGTRWLALKNMSGLLLAERLHEVDERGLPLHDTLTLLNKLLDGLAQQRPEGIFGYIEPGVILLNDKAPCFLNAPVAAALRLTNAGSAENNRPTLHSRYISPEVLLGDVPTAADDTFSLACIAYQLLQGQPPYGVHSTLEAAVRNVHPLPIRKLSPDAGQALQQGMNLHRAARQPTPQTLLNALNHKSRKKLLLPVASLALGCVAALGTYQLLSKWATTPTAPTTTVAVAPKPPEPVEPPAPEVPPPQVQPLPDKDPPQYELEQLAKEAHERTEADKKAGDTIPTSETGTPEATTIGQLLELTTDAIRKGQLISEGPDKLGALDYLRKVRALEPENTTAQKLLTQVVNDQQAEAEALIANMSFDEAGNILAVSDKLITEFNLSDNLPRQVKLDNAVRERKPLQPPVSTTDSATPSSTTTSPSPAAEPAKTDDKAAAVEDTKKAQEQALVALRKGNTEKARTYLDQSKSLITKFELTSLVEAQIALEKRFSETKTTMGISATNEENTKKEPTTTAVNPSASMPSSMPLPNPETSTLVRPRITMTPVENSPSAPVPTVIPNERNAAEQNSPEFVSLPKAEEQTTAPQTMPVPVEVSTPVATPVPVTPPVNHQVAKPAPKRVVSAVASTPVTNPNPSTQVPEIMEVPLEDIDAALPNPDTKQR